MISGQFSRVRKEMDFNADWRFIRDDLPGAHQTDFDDRAWRSLELPHDWSIEENFDEKLASGTGFLPGGIGWYRKTFRITEALDGRRVRIEFDGAYKNSEVWCNGAFLGQRPSGYASFGYDLTPHLRSDGMPNVISVRVDHTDYADSRWYTGSGIYREVRLVVTSDVHVKRHGIFITTPEVREKNARIEIQTTIVNEGKSHAQLTLVSAILAPDGEAVATIDDALSVATGEETAITQTIEIENPFLWSPQYPHIYTLHTLIKRDDERVDDLRTPFGIRTFHFDRDRGFSLNGVSMKIKGVCVHHDAGALGAAVPTAVWKRRLHILKELGCNAIRMSHNPPASNLLDLCDTMGFLVMDEAFDEWTGCKRKWVEGWNCGTPAFHGYAEHFEEWSERDLQEMVLRDRNHPSIVLWSIGNEIDYVDDPFPPNEPALAPIARRLVAIVKSIDATRPVTAALASPETSLFADCLDIAGYNYHEDLYEKDRARYSDRVLYGSENLKDLHAWQAVEEHDFIAGLHLWTGIDFLGEAAAWPARNSEAGLLDIAGFKKPVAYFWQSLWSDAPMVHIGLDESDGGQPALVCYTNCESVELLQDGASLGELRLSEHPGRMLRWMIPSAAGIYTAFGKKQGEIVCSTEWRPWGPPERIKAIVDRATLLANGNDVAHIEVQIIDANGVRVVHAEHSITCAIEGPARLIGMENGDPCSHEPYKTNRRRVFRGRLLLYVQAAREPGEVKVSLTAEGLPPKEVAINVDPTGSRMAELSGFAQMPGDAPRYRASVQSEPVR